MDCRMLRIAVAFTCVGLLAACDGDDDGGGDDEPADGGMMDVVPSDDVAPDDGGQDDVRADDTSTVDTGRDADGGGGDRSLSTVETPSADQCGAPAEATLEHAAVAEGHCAWEFADGISGPRGIEIDDSGDILVVSENSNDITALHDDNGNRVIDDGERTTLVDGGPGLNHGLWLKDGYLYASSASTVYRWPYGPGQRSELADREVVVDGIPTGGHSTRTLVGREGSDWLYVNFGSRGNVTENPNRALVKRFDLSSIPDGGYDASGGEIQADGLRNEVALTFDRQNRLWGMQNGMDNLSRDDLGGDIHADNPAEEVNLLEETGEFHGYPYCWTEYSLPDDVARGRGSQWAMPRFMDDGTHSDEWCRNRDNVRPPELALQAHTAPLGMEFYYDDELHPALQGDALAALHGSWNRPVPVGYNVVRIMFDDQGKPTGVEPFLEYAGDGATDDQEWPHRPVEPAFTEDGLMLVTSDASNRVLAVGATQ